MQYQQVSMQRRPLPGFHSNVISRVPAPRRTTAPVLRVPLQRPVMVTTADIVQRLGVTTLAITKWRKGSGSRDPLPARVSQVKNHNEVLFRETELLEWLRVYRPDLKERWQVN